MSMSHITSELVHELWLQTPKSDWDSFYYTLKNVEDVPHEVEFSDEMRSELRHITENIMVKDEPFPESEGDLYELLNNWAH
jgi:hypothetical protein